MFTSGMKRFVFKVCTLKDAFLYLLHKPRTMRENMVLIVFQIFRAFTEENPDKMKASLSKYLLWK